MTTRSSGFTLIELLVVVAILGIISAIGIVSYNGYVSSAKKKSAENIINGIQQSKSAPFHKVLFGLGIRYVGETVAKKLTSYFKDINQLRSSNFEELCSIE